MKRMQVGELKARFSEVIEEVKGGEEIVVSYGKKREDVAVLIPYRIYSQANRIKLGTLKGKASVTFGADFEMTSEELIGR
ncbi:MAG: type II toxin-antitoxin system Phd/YefM family antitoxin [Spirochaetaceae bacterium]